MDGLKPLRDDIVTLDLGAPILLRRCDQIHPETGGNKWYKLKYNIREMQRLGKEVLVTFGGPHSNHIAASASAAKHYGVQSIGIIRGDEPSTLTPTLLKAQKDGMTFIYPGRETYDMLKDGDMDLSEYLDQNKSYILPEGGANVFAVEGCTEILDLESSAEVICCPVGTGATLAGLIVASKLDQKVIGFSSLRKVEDQILVIKNLLMEYDVKQGTSHSKKENWRLVEDNLFGGFAKMDKTLYNFVSEFEKKQNIQLDYIYNGKMMYKIGKMFEAGNFSNTDEILAIHTGGTQGNRAMIERWKHKFKD